MANSSEQQPYYYQYRFMREACENPHHPNYDKYGGAGVSCHWGRRQYDEFYDWLVNTLGHRPGPSNQWVLGRKDKRGNWEPGNIEWQTVIKRSRTNHKQNVYATYRKKTKTLIQWAEDLGIPYHTFRRRYAEGWTMAQIVKEYT